MTSLPAKSPSLSLTGSNLARNQAITAGLLAVLYAWLCRNTDAEIGYSPAIIAAIVLGGIALVKGCTARFQNDLIKQIANPKPYFRTYGEMLEIVRDPAHQSDRWIGRGFFWGHSHRQMEKELSKTDWRKDQQQIMTKAAMWRFIKRNPLSLLTSPFLTLHTVLGKKHRVAISPGAHWLRALDKETPQYLSEKDLEGHMVIFGTTGSGKSRFMDTQLFQAVLSGQSVIVLDPKGDKGLQRTMQEACKLSGQPERFVYFHPGFPERSASINPLANYADIGNLASRIANALPGQSGEGRTFVSMQEGVLRTVVLGMEITRERPTLETIYHYLLNRDELAEKALRSFIVQTHDEKTLTDVLQAQGNQPALQALRSFYSRTKHMHCPEIDSILELADRDPVHLQKTCTSVLNLLQRLTAGKLGALLSPRGQQFNLVPTDLQQIINKGCVLYVGLDSLSDSELARSIGSLLLSDLAATAGARYNFEASPKPVFLFVDEAGELACEPLTQMLNKARGAKFTICIATQTVADFTSKCEKPADALRILANLNNFFALRCNDSETQRFLTDRLEKTIVTSTMRSHGISTRADYLSAQNGTLSERLVEEEADLVSSSILGCLPNCEYFAIVAGGNVIKGRVPIVVATASEFVASEY